MTARRVLVTGAGGFVGRPLAAGLVAAGFDVVGWTGRTSSQANTLPVDLLDTRSVRRAMEAAGGVQTVVHLAALAHGQHPPKSETVVSANVRMVENILAAIPTSVDHLIGFSSVAVYGHVHRGPVFGLHDDLRPVTSYGKSKKLSEECFIQAGIDLDLLRLSPVFDSGHLGDVRKRVCFPKTRLRLKFHPVPSYSLCPIDLAVAKAVELVGRGPSGQWLHQLSAPVAYSQSELQKWFYGPQVSIPVATFRPFYVLARLLPGNYGDILQWSLDKLLKSNIFPTESRSLDKPFVPTHTVRG